MQERLAKTQLDVWGRGTRPASGSECRSCDPREHRWGQREASVPAIPQVQKENNTATLLSSLSARVSCRVCVFIVTPCHGR